MYVVTHVYSTSIRKPPSEFTYPSAAIANVCLVPRPFLSIQSFTLFNTVGKVSAWSTWAWKR